jgi:signal transduction histidine kinase
VLANLLSNAIKFSPSESTIQIVVKRESMKNIHLPGKVTINFSVIDEGVGISIEDQKSLFLPYSQIRPGELQQGRGTGVGLAICREIILLHNGEVRPFFFIPRAYFLIIYGFFFLIIFFVLFLLPPR